MAGTIQMKHGATGNAEFPNALNDYLYRVEKDGTVSAVNSRGERVQFGDWRSFWEAAASPVRVRGEIPRAYSAFSDQRHAEVSGRRLLLHQ